MITLVYDERWGDWEALYQDGYLVYQGHRVTARDLLEYLKIPHEIIEDGDADEDAFPKHVKDIKRFVR